MWHHMARHGVKVPTKKKCGRDDEVGAGRDGYSKSAVVELVRIREEDKCCWVGITRELDILKVRN